jgi:hypothetical protein
VDDTTEWKEGEKEEKSSRCRGRKFAIWGRRIKAPYISTVKIKNQEGNSTKQQWGRDLRGS